MNTDLHGFEDGFSVELRVSKHRIHLFVLFMIQPGGIHSVVGEGDDTGTDTDKQ